MKFLELKMRLIAPLVVVCCLAGVGSQVAQAQTPPTFQTGDVFVAIGGFSVGDVLGTGKVLWYRPNGTPTPTLVATLDTGQANTEVAGMAFDAAGNLYATVFEANNVVKFDMHGTLLGTFGSGYTNASTACNTLPGNNPESIVFDSTGNAYVGEADGTCQVLKFDASGNPLAQFSPATENRGTDWIDLAGDQKTLYYTSEGTHVKRFDLSTNTQILPDFNPVALPGPAAYALRILPNGEVLVVDTDRVVLLDSSGNVAQTYLATSLEPGSTCIPATTPCPLLFGMTLDPDGKSFWTADLSAGTVWKVDIATGAIDLTINTGSNDVGGVVVFHEITASNSVQLHFPPSPASTQTAPFLTNNDPTNPASHAVALTINVVNTGGIDVTVHAITEPTEITTDPITGIGIADGICEVGSPNPPLDDDVDCRLAAGGFVYRTLVSGDQVVPHCAAYDIDRCVWYRETTTAKEISEVPPGSPSCSSTQGPPCYDYVGPVYDKIGFNTNVVLANPSPNPANPQGWNNKNGRVYDRHGDDPNNAFKFDITDSYDINGDVSKVLAGDQTGTGHHPKINDLVIADVPNPPAGSVPDTVERFVPVPGISPFPYLRGVPMLVTFELENESAETSDGTALTAFHTVNVATVDNNGVVIPVQPFPGFGPTTFSYNKKSKLYSTWLSPAPYKLSDGTPKTVYTLLIGSDLFPEPVAAKFKVCTLVQVLTHTCP